MYSENILGSTFGFVAGVLCLIEAFKKRNAWLLLLGFGCTVLGLAGILSELK